MHCETSKLLTAIWQPADRYQAGTHISIYRYTVHQYVREHQTQTTAQGNTVGLERYKTSL